MAAGVILVSCQGSMSKLISLYFAAFKSLGVSSCQANYPSRRQARQSSSQSIQNFRTIDCKTRWLWLGSKTATRLWRHRLWSEWRAPVPCTRDNFRRNDWSTSWHVGVWRHIIYSIGGLPAILEQQRRKITTIYSTRSLYYAFAILGQCIRRS